MTTPVQGQQFDPDEQKLLDETAEHWRKVWNEAPVQALTRVEDAAKQMIVVTTGLQGLYVAIFVFSDIRAQVAVAAGGVLGVLILFLFLFFLPAGSWLVSLIYATCVFVPRVRPGVDLNELSAGEWRKIRDEYGRVNEKKLRWLHRSHGWLIASFVFVLIAVVVLVLLPAAPTGPSQIIIVTPTPIVRPTSTP
jgi:hypothetical protein